jgi:hypothetical protein
MFGMI